MTAIAQLPNKAAYVQAWRIAKTSPPGARLLWDRDTWDVVDPLEAVRRFRRALDRRINSRGGHEEFNDPLPVGLVRDAHRLDDIRQRRVRVYQLETPRLARRFAHLLASSDER